MSRLGTYVTNFVKTAIYTIQPNKVEEYPYDQYEAEYGACKCVFQLHDSFFFYKVANHYDMVYIPLPTSFDVPPKERKVYSIFRFQGEVDAGIAIFKSFAEVVHAIVKICDIYNVKVDKAWLEKVTSLCRQHPKWTLAHFCASLNFTEAFQNELVSKWVNEPDKDTGETPLHVALKALAVETVKAILALPQTRLDICDIAGNTVLHVAVEMNSLNLLETLLNNESAAADESSSSSAPSSATLKFKCFRNASQVDINAMNSSGETCLYLAVRNGSEAFVETLLQAGANPKIGNTDCLPIHLAVEKNLPRCVDLLCNYYPDVINCQTREKKLSTLHKAKKRKMFDHLLELGADPNLRDINGRTVLHLAVDEQDLDTVMQLLIYAADPNMADNRGIYPLHLAVARCQDVHIVYALIVFEANVNATDDEGLTPRHWLCQHESNVYQRSSIRDTMLYALDVVQAQRCPPGRANCTAGCVSTQELTRRDQPMQAGGLESQDGQNRGSSIGYLTQLLQDIPFASFRSNTDPTGEVFNGTPPDPVLTNTNLTQDIDNDLFLFLSGGKSGSKTSKNSISSNSTLPHAHSVECHNNRCRSASPPMRPIVEEAAEAKANAEATQSDPEERVGSTTPTNNEGEAQTVLPWLRRTVVARFISSALPGLDSLFADDTGVKSDHEESGPPSPLPLQPAGPLSDQVAPAAEQGLPKSNHHPEESIHPPNYEDNCEHRSWSRYIRGCSARPGVPCCMERFSRRLSVHHDENENMHTSMPPMTLSTVCPPAHLNVPEGSSTCECMMRDAEGFRASRRGYRVLCLDGGGIRGLVLCQVLRAIERVAERPIRDLYDWVIGTSTGAMLALNIVLGKCVRYNRCLYFRLKEKVFVGARPYPTEGLEKLLREEFGENSVMSDIADVRVSVTALRSDHFPPRLHMFRNYPAPYERMERLVSELIEARSPHVTPTDPSDVSVVSTERTLKKTPPPKKNVTKAGEKVVPLQPESSTSTVNESTTNTNPISTEVPCKLLLASFLRDLFGETLREVGRGGEDESDLQESIVSLLSSFSRRYMYGSKEGKHSLPSNEQILHYASELLKSTSTGDFLVTAVTGAISDNEVLDWIPQLWQQLSQDDTAHYLTWRDVPGGADTLIWRAARASGAAPSYFRACGPFLDGGLIANNPTLDLLTEAQELNIVRRLRREMPVPIASITSLGTGRMPLREVQQLDVYRPQNVSEAYHVAVGVTELSRVLVEMATQSEGRIVERSRAWCSSLGVPFFRFSPLLSESVNLDTKDTRAILQMLWETESYLCNCRDRIHRLVDSLLHGSESSATSTTTASISIGSREDAYS